MFTEIFKSLVDAAHEFGHLGVFILMTIESTFVPLPSEIVLIPAGYLVREGKLNFTLVVLASTFGSLFGALINYYLSLWIGRPLILKYGKYFMLKEERYLFVEKKFLEHGALSTFLGRLVFGVRHYISIPAGLARMNLFSFSLYTTLGAGLWSIILVSFGYILGGDESAVHKAKLFGLWFAGALVLIGIVYYLWTLKKRASSPA